MSSRWIFVCVSIALLGACEDEPEQNSVASNTVSPSTHSATTGSGGAGGTLASGGSPGGGGGGGRGVSDIGGPCTEDNDCMKGQECITQFPGGYCTIRNCDPNADSCPRGTVCLGGGAIGSFGCFVECTTAADCREAEGYACCGPSVCSAPGFGFCS